MDLSIEQIKELNSIVIFGAGVMGRALKMCLESKPFDRRVSCFIVSSMENNPEFIDGIPVIDIEFAYEYKKDAIIVALNEKNLPGAIEILYNHGFENLLLLNAAGDEWSNIKEVYFLNNQDQCYMPFKMLPESE